MPSQVEDQTHLKPSFGHYQGILRSIIAVVVIASLFYFTEIRDVQILQDITEGRRGMSLTADAIIALLMGCVCALGLDRVLVPFLKPLSTKPQIEIITNGIRYLYTNSKADILFSDIEKAIVRSEPEPSIEIFTIAGQFIEIQQYTNMDNLIEHLKQGNVQFEQPN